MTTYKKLRELKRTEESIRDSLYHLESVSSDLLKDIAPDLINDIDNNINYQKELLKKIKSAKASLESELKNSVLALVKNGNTIHITTGDGISYIEHQYIHITNENPDWRDMIKFEIAVVGYGDTGNWLKYDEVDYLKLDKLIELLNSVPNDNLELVDYSVLEIYKNYSKNIPEDARH